MADTTKDVIGIADLFNDKSPVGKAFRGMSYKEKMDVFQDTEKHDPVFKTFSHKERDDIFHDLIWSTHPAQPQPGTAPSMPTLSPAAPFGASHGATTLPSSPPSPTPGPLEDIARVAGHGIVQGVEMLPALATGLGSVITSGAEKLGIAPTTPPEIRANAEAAGTRPLQTAMGYPQGFPPETPGLALTQHYIASLTSSAIATPIVAKIFPLLQAGVPLTDQQLRAAWMTMKGVTAGEAVKQFDAPPWVQVATELVAGGVGKDEVMRVLRGIKDRWSLLTQIKGLSDKGGEAFGGPSFQETRTTLPGETPPTAASHTNVLEQSVGDIKAPVLDAQQRRATAEAQATSAGQRVSDLGADVLTEEQAAMQARRIAQAPTRQNVLAEVATARAAKTKADEAKAALATQQADLDRTTLATQQRVNRALNEAETSAKDLTPEIATAAPGAEASAGLGLVEKGGGQGQVLYQGARAHFDLKAKEAYTKLHAEHQIEASAKPLNDAIKEYDAEMLAAQRGSYEPHAAITEAKKMIADLAPESASPPGAQVAEGAASVKNVDDAVLNLEQIHMIRSRAVQDRRNMTYSDPRRAPLDRYISKIDAAMESMADGFPETSDAFKALNGVNQWYKTNIRMFTPRGSPGEVALKMDPRSGQPVESPLSLGNRIFNDGPMLPNIRQAQVENAAFFQAHMENLDRIATTAKQDGNLGLLAQTQAAKDGVLDIARAKFYAAAMQSGAYDAKAAEKWLAQHDALIQSRPELQQLFRDARARLQTIRQTEAAGQGLLAEEKGYLLQFAHQTDLAKEAASTATTGVATAREALQAQRAQASVPGTAPSRLEEIRLQHRVAKAEAGKLEEAATLTRTEEQAALDEYRATFGGRVAADHALTESRAADVLGASPRDIVHQIEGMATEGERNFAYTKWFREAGGNPQVKDALLYEKWKSFVGPDGIADPKKAVQFITENTPFLRKFYPDYLKDIQTIQAGFEKAARLQETKPFTLSPRHGPQGAAMLVASLMGYHHWPAIVTGASIGTYEAGRLMNAARQIHQLQAIYTTPAITRDIAQAIRGGDPTWVATKVWSALTRSGALALTAEEATGDGSTP